jgi:hypothetical protein
VFVFEFVEVGRLRAMGDVRWIARGLGGLSSSRTVRPVRNLRPQVCRRWAEFSHWRCGKGSFISTQLGPNATSVTLSKITTFVTF